MKKDAFFFRHDCNAFSDPKMQRMVMANGLEGYGFYFLCLEMMRNEKDYMIDNDPKVISFHTRLDVKTVERLLQDSVKYLLFSVDGDKLLSESFLNRMQLMDEVRNRKSKGGKASAEARKKARLLQDSSKTPSKSLSTKEEEIKEEIKEEIEIPLPSDEVDAEIAKKEAARKKKEELEESFEAFWSDYPKVRKGNKKSAKSGFCNLSAADREKCHTALFIFKAKDRKWKDGFSPEAVNFINKRIFEDEPELGGGNSAGRGFDSTTDLNCPMNQEKIEQVMNMETPF